jgi:hypothetical protein
MNGYRLWGMNYKYLFGTTMVLLLLGAGVYMYLKVVQDTNNPTLSPQEQYIKSENEKYAALEEAYKNDPYGGSTPEETLQMYIVALEKGDIEMAVNLFAVEDRENAKVSFDEAKYMKEYILHLKMKSVFIPSAAGLDEASLEFYNEEGEQSHAEDFKLNPFSNKWKLVHKNT